MKIAEQVTFGGGGLDRAASERMDEVALGRLIRAPEARILPIWKGKPQVRGMETLSLAPVDADAPVLAHMVEAPLFLGRAAGQVWFAADVSRWEPEAQDTDMVGAFLDPSEQRFPGQSDDTRFAELRQVMAGLNPLDAELAATSRGLLEWHRTHGFCANCGVRSAPTEAGWQRHCPACERRHFPRTDPVVIMLVTRGNSVLMGRSPGWPEGMYSLLAGFVEPGETIEAAVRREVFEEAGVRVGAVSYLASQPWPFPASLMIGCHGVAVSDEIAIDPAEIEDARWVPREEMLDVFAGRHPLMKAGRQGAIARFILSHWLADRLD
jgi:NAD+ diphosphatase